MPYRPVTPADLEPALDRLLADIAQAGEGRPIDRAALLDLFSHVEAEPAAAR